MIAAMTGLGHGHDTWCPLWTSCPGVPQAGQVCNRRSDTSGIAGVGECPCSIIREPGLAVVHFELDLQDLRQIFIYGF